MAFLFFTLTFATSWSMQLEGSGAIDREEDGPESNFGNENSSLEAESESESGLQWRAVQDNDYYRPFSSPNFNPMSEVNADTASDRERDLALAELYRIN